MCFPNPVSHSGAQCLHWVLQKIMWRVCPGVHRELSRTSEAAPLSCHICSWVVLFSQFAAAGKPAGLQTRIITLCFKYAPKTTDPYSTSEQLSHRYGSEFKSKCNACVSRRSPRPTLGCSRSSCGQYVPVCTVNPFHSNFRSVSASELHLSFRTGAASRRTCTLANLFHNFVRQVCAKTSGPIH